MSRKKIGPLCYKENGTMYVKDYGTKVFANARDGKVAKQIKEACELHDFFMPDENLVASDEVTKVENCAVGVWCYFDSSPGYAAVLHSRCELGKECFALFVGIENGKVDTFYVPFGVNVRLGVIFERKHEPESLVELHTEAVEKLQKLFDKLNDTLTRHLENHTQAATVEAEANINSRLKDVETTLRGL